MKSWCLLTFIALLVPALKADEWDERTVVTFKEPVEVPGLQNHGHGVVLSPGTYVMKLMDSSSDRDVVQIFNKDESQIYTTTIAIPEYRTEPTDHTVLDFAERPKGTPEALKDWYYPGNLRGEEFLYSKPLMMMASQTNPAPAPKQMATAKPAPAPTPAPAPVEAKPQPAPAPAPQASAPSAPVRIAQAKPNPAPAPPPKELPKTAGDMSLIGLAGLISLAAGFGLQKRNE